MKKPILVLVLVFISAGCGGMGGFSAAGGVEMKEKMLELEREIGHRIEHTLAMKHLHHL